MTGASDPEAIIEGFSRKLQSQWEQHRRQSFNTNTKGKAYEQALSEFLQEYFGGVYDIKTRVAVVDEPFRCFDTLSSGENEIDVVATFKQAVPRIILESGDMIWVPWDAVSFVCEVKSALTKKALEEDLEKLAKLNELGPKNRTQRFPQYAGRTEIFTGDRTNKKMTRDVSVDHQLKCLVYDEYNTSAESLFEVSNEFTDIWDLILLVEKDLLLISPKLPFVEAWYDRTTFRLEDGTEMDVDRTNLPDILALPNGLVWFVLLLAISIPRPPPFDACSSLIQLVQGEWIDEGHLYQDVIGAWEELF